MQYMYLQPLSGTTPHHCYRWIEFQVWGYMTVHLVTTVNLQVLQLVT